MMASMYSTSPESFSSWASSPADAQATRPATTSGSSNPHNGAAGGEVGMHHPQHQYHHGLACSDLVGDFGVAGSTNTDPAAGFERSCVSAQRQQQGNDQNQHHHQSSSSSSSSLTTSTNAASRVNNNNNNNNNNNHDASTDLSSFPLPSPCPPSHNTTTTTNNNNKKPLLDLSSSAFVSSWDNTTTNNNNNNNNNNLLLCHGNVSPASSDFSSTSLNDDDDDDDDFFLDPFFFDDDVVDSSLTLLTDADLDFTDAIVTTTPSSTPLDHLAGTVMGIDTVAADGQRTGSHSHQHQHQHHEATDTEREERGCDGVVEESGLAQEVRGRAGAFSKAQSLVVKEEEVGEHDNGFGMFGFGFADDIRHHHLPSSSTNTNPSMPLSPLPLTATTNTAATGTRSTLGGFDDAFASEPFLPGDGMDMNMSMDLNAAGKRSPGLDSCSSWPDMDMDMGASTSSASHFEESPAKRARVSHQQPHHVSQPANSKAGKKRAAMRNNNSSSSSNNGGKSTKAPSTTATTTTTAATTATATANTTELLPEEVRTKNAVLQRLGRERSPEQLKALEAKVTGYIDSLPDEKTRKKLRDELPVFGRWASMSVAELRQAEYDLLCLILGSPPDENLTDIEQFLSLTSEDRRGRKAQLRSKKNRRLTKKRIIELERQLDDATARELKKDQQLALLQKKCNKLMELARQHPDFALLSLDN